MACRKKSTGKPHKRARIHNRCTDLPTFLTFIKSSGGWIHNDVDFHYSKSFGLHCVATQAISANEPIFSLPLRLCITSATACNHSVIGPILMELQHTCSLNQMQFNRACVFALLMYHVHLGSSSPLFSYLALLPTAEELESRIATMQTSSSSTKPASLLAGTWIGTHCIPRHLQTLETIHLEITSVIGQRLSISNSFSRDLLAWSAGIFHSRAIMVPNENRASNMRCEGLTPLIDILNHRPGYLSELSRPSSSPSKNNANSKSKSDLDSVSILNAAFTTTAEDVVVYKVGRTIQQNEQIFLNYGPKSNLDLLSHFGFCLHRNICDVLKVEINGEEVTMYEDCQIAIALNLCREVASVKQPGSGECDSQEQQLNNVYVIDDDDDNDDCGNGGGSAAWFQQMLKEEETNEKSRTVLLSTIGTPLSKDNEKLALTLMKNLVQPFIGVAEMNDTRKVDADRLSFESDVHTYLKGVERVALFVSSTVCTLEKMLSSENL